MRRIMTRGPAGLTMIDEPIGSGQPRRIAQRNTDMNRKTLQVFLIVDESGTYVAAEDAVTVKELAANACISENTRRLITLNVEVTLPENEVVEVEVPVSAK